MAKQRKIVLTITPRKITAKTQPKTAVLSERQWRAAQKIAELMDITPKGKK